MSISKSLFVAYGRQRQENQELRDILCDLISLEAAWTAQDLFQKNKNLVAGKFTEWVEGLSQAHEDPGSERRAAGLVAQMLFQVAGGNPGGSLGSPGASLLYSRPCLKREGVGGMAQWLQHRMLP